MNVFGTSEIIQKIFIYVIVNILAEYVILDSLRNPYIK